MFLIHKVEEGQVYRIGINYSGPDKRQVFMFTIVLPVFILPRQKYFDWYDYNHWFGMRLVLYRFRCRLAKRPDGLLWIFISSTYKRPIGRQVLIETREMMEDGRAA